MTHNRTKDQERTKSFKIIMVGNSGVGKSTFLVRYIDNIYNPQIPTVGLDYRLKKLKKGDENFNLQLWDSAGQERYRNIVFSYFKHSKAALIVFDINDKQSLEDCRFWFKQLCVNCGDSIPMALVGNKSDLLKNKPNKQEHLAMMNQIIREYEKQFNAKYFEASSMTGDNVQQIFDYIFQKLYQNYKASTSDNEKGNFELRPKPVRFKEEPKRCCK